VKRSLPEAQVPNAQDVALQQFNQALESEAAGDYDTALRILSDIARHYPEFVPPRDDTLTERMTSLEKRISYAGTIRWARQVMSGDEPIPERLREVIVELAGIPTTDGEFGEEAMLLTDQAKSLLKQIQLGFLKRRDDGGDEVAGTVDGASLEAPAEGGKGETVPPAEGKEEAEAAEDVDAEQKLVEEARARALYLYREGAFLKAVRHLRDRAGEVSDEAGSKALAEMATRIDKFGKDFDKGRSLLKLSGRETEAIAILESARKMDKALAGVYQKKIERSLVVPLTKKATARLSSGDYKSARASLDEARKLDSSAKEVAQLANLFSFRSTALLRQARKEQNRETRTRLLEDVLLLSEKGGPAEKEARAILKQMEAQ